MIILFLSTSADCLDITLTAATRVIVFDACFNPSYDEQSIYRVYRAVDFVVEC